jgi:hypothetical protein
MTSKENYSKGMKVASFRRGSALKCSTTSAYSFRVSLFLASFRFKLVLCGLVYFFSAFEISERNGLNDLLVLSLTLATVASASLNWLLFAPRPGAGAH